VVDLLGRRLVVRFWSAIRQPWRRWQTWWATRAEIDPQPAMLTDAPAAKPLAGLLDLRLRVVFQPGRDEAAELCPARGLCRAVS